MHKVCQVTGEPYGFFLVSAGARDERECWQAALVGHNILPQQHKSIDVGFLQGNWRHVPLAAAHILYAPE